MRGPSRSIRVHGSCVALADAARAFGAASNAGILLLGPSGAGKSDLALRLIERGAMLVADDQTELFGLGGTLQARAPGSLAGLIEIRGVGLIRLPRAESARVALCVALHPLPVSRLPQPEFYELPAELETCNPVPLLRLDPREGSAPAKVAAALAGSAREPYPLPTPPESS